MLVSTGLSLGRDNNGVIDSYWSALLGCTRLRGPPLFAAFRGILAEISRPFVKALLRKLSTASKLA